MTKALVIVSSRTGNTRIVGHAVADALGAEYAGAETYLESPALYADCNPVILGFWNDRGMAPEDMQAVAKMLHEKRIGFFATMGGDPASERAAAWMEKVTEGLLALGRDNVSVTSLLVRGRIDPALFERMTQMMGGTVSPEREARRREAETHPDRMDLLKAEKHFSAAFPECRVLDRRGE